MTKSFGTQPVPCSLTNCSTHARTRHAHQQLVRHLAVAFFIDVLRNAALTGLRLSGLGRTDVRMLVRGLAVPRDTAIA